MRVGNFTLLIPEGREYESGHTSLNHGDVYTIRATNHWFDRRCDAEILVDGKPVGDFRVERGQTITIERPVNDQGWFTFYRIDTAEATEVGAAEIANADRGVVQVRFRPEVVEREVKTAGGIPFIDHMFCTPKISSYCSDKDLSRSLSFSPETATAGVTGLSGHSSQQFTNVRQLTYDPSEEVLITLRLVDDGRVKNHPRKLLPARKQNHVPNPV